MSTRSLTAPTATPTLVSLPTGVRIRPVTLELDDAVPLRELVRLAEQLGGLDRSCPWWIGDLVLHAQWVYGVDAYDMVCKATGLSRQTAMNYKLVASRFPISRRREMISMAHHAEVVGIEHPMEQDRWLRDAEAHGWSRKELRERIALSLRPEPDAPALPPVRGLQLRAPLPDVEAWEQAATLSGGDVKTCAIQAVNAWARRVIADSLPILEEA